MKTESGFTLVEFMIVIAILGIVAASALTFPPFMQRSSVESYAKEIKTLLTKARNDAATTNTRQLVLLAANQVQSGPDILPVGAPDGVIDAGLIATKNYPKFTINFSAANNPIAFDRRGLTNDNQTISITGYNAGVAPAVDCVVVFFTRINVGRMNGGNCVQQ